MWKDARTQTRMWGIGVNTDWTLHWGWQRDTHRHNRNLMSGDFVGYMTQSSTLNSNSLEDPRISKGRPTATSSIQSPSVTGIMKPFPSNGQLSKRWYDIQYFCRFYCPRMVFKFWFSTDSVFLLFLTDAHVHPLEKNTIPGTPRNFTISRSHLIGSTRNVHSETLSVLSHYNTK